jgi:hypothetical protein
LLATGIDQGEIPAKELGRDAIVAERAVDLAHAQVAHDGEIDVAELFGDAQRRLARAQRRLRLPDVPERVPEEAQHLRHPRSIAGSLGELERLVHEGADAVMLPTGHERVAEVAAHIDRRRLRVGDVLERGQRLLEVRDRLAIAEVGERAEAGLARVDSGAFPHLAAQRMPRELVDVVACLVRLHDAGVEVPPSLVEQALVDDVVHERVLELHRAHFVVGDEEVRALEPRECRVEGAPGHLEHLLENVERRRVPDRRHRLKHALVVRG